MKKIRNIKDLEHEKLKLRVKQLELEKEMNQSWKDVKSKLSTQASEAAKAATEAVNFNTGNALLSNALNIGTGVLGKRLGFVAGDKVESVVYKLMGKLADKVNARAERRKKTRKN